MADRKKEEFMTHIEHYRAVLDDLQNQRAMHQLEIAEIDSAINSLARLIPQEAKEALPVPDPPRRAKPFEEPAQEWATYEWHRGF